MTNGISLVLSGEAGQGLKTFEDFLTNVFNEEGFYIFSSKEYMSRVRGGNNTVEIRISEKKVYCYVDKIDLLLLLNNNAIDRVKSRITDSTMILMDEESSNEIQGGNYNSKILPINAKAKELGSTIYSNTIMIGIIAASFNLNIDSVTDKIKKKFEKKGEAAVTKNIEAIKIGYKMAEDNKITFSLGPIKDISGRVLMEGTKSIGIGAITGGCNFISSYPMSPGTGVITYLAEKADEYGIIVEQAEDEISAINMVLGSWYAGAKGIATTSGGGFALMEEGISLSGVTEIPCVIHLAQRPGPGTGLPTRTEQGDLKLALYAGHGEFPRAIFAPGTNCQGIEVTNRAFYIADKYQIPAFILTDQYFLDSYSNIDKIEFENLLNEKHIIKTEQNYNRYKLTENGVSPRGIPGYGTGLVCCDSDEHDETGHITENFEIREKMVEKRLKKSGSINEESLKPEIIGSSNYEIIVVCWGSNYGVIKETIENLNHEKIAAVHFRQVFPLHKNTKEILSKAKIRVIVENNATSQFGELIKLKTGIDFDFKILKYNGMPFSLEEISAELMEVIKNG